MKDSQLIESTLDALLKKTQQGPALLLPDELSDLVSAFATSQPISVRSKAYLALSSYCRGVENASIVKGKQPDPATESLIKQFGPAIASRLESAEEDLLLIILSFFSALFQVDSQLASAILQIDGVLHSITDIIDILPTSALCLAVAHLVAQACSHKSCRAIIPPQVTTWLELKSRQTTDSELRAAAAIALIKLSKGSEADMAEVAGSTAQADAGKGVDDLAELMKELVITADGEKSSVQDAIEGLAYLSIDPQVKESLSKDKVFLEKLFATTPQKKSGLSAGVDLPNNTLLYGILSLVTNICAYRPRLSEEQQHIEKLKRMAKTSQTTAGPSDVLDDDSHVKQRIRRMIDAGVLTVFPATASYMDSHGIRKATSSALLNIVEDKDNRGKVLQSGGAKILGLIIKHDSTSLSKDSTQAAGQDTVPLEAIQALAKLAITSSPIQVFGPNEGAMYDIVRPFSTMVQHSSATLLQRFEAMMALTNLATQNPELASRITQAEGLINRVELLLLEDHTLVRRAAMELICNLIVGSDDMFEKYGGGEDTTGTRSKLRVVLAISDVDDLPTRIAASGALATLTMSPNACRALAGLQQEHHRALLILTQLIDPFSIPEDQRDDDGDDIKIEMRLIHRGVVCVRNLFTNINEEATVKSLAKEAVDAGLVKALGRVIKGELGRTTEVILRPAIEALKSISKSIE
ncbi:hypothetical protein AX17_000631 [Amanita inopinata Kibby_2008]|nr:hypothetical protein AX17_000631 [Amanita inopinata Kibby_2008]